MARDKLTEYSATASENTVCGDVNIAENSALPSDMNNFAREVMSHLKAFSDGTDAIDALAVDNLKLDGNTISSTDTNGDINVIPNGTGEVVFHSTADSDNYVQVSSANNSEAGIRFRGDGSLGTGTDIGYEGNGNRFFINTVSSGTATERVSMNSSGDVGIGRTNPEGIVGTHGGGLVVQSASGRASSTSHVVFQDSSGNNQFELQHGGLIIHRAGSTETMRMNTNGELLIGTTAGGSSNRLHIKGPKTVCVIANTDANGGTYQETILFRNSTDGGVGSITTNSTSVSYNTTSDHRLKENVADMTGAIDRVKALAPKRFNFIAEADTTVDGFLAHEAQTVVPEAVTGTHNEVETWTQQQIDDGDAPDGTSAGDNKLDEDGNTIPVYQGIDQAKLVPLLTGALREAIAKIETLETKVAALEAAG